MTEYLSELRQNITTALGPLLGTYVYPAGSTPALKVEGISRADDKEQAPELIGLEVVIEPEMEVQATPNHDGVSVQREVKVTLKQWGVGTTIPAREELMRLPNFLRAGPRIPPAKGLGNIETQTLFYQFPQRIRRIA